jgi:hypothetical protein
MTPGGTHPYEKWPAIGMPPVRGPEPLYGRILAERAEKAPTRQQLVLTADDEAVFLAAREDEQDQVAAEFDGIVIDGDDEPLPRRVPGATLPGRMATRVACEPPSLEDMARVNDALRRKFADEAKLPPVPDTPAALLATTPAPEPEPEGWREWLAEMAWGAARHAEPPGKDICAWCRESIADWCDPCADAIELAAALDALHDEILAAPDMATALRLMTESATWRTTHGETAITEQG